MKFKSLLNNDQLLTIFHNVLTNEETKNKKSNISLNGEDYEYNQYSLLIVMDFVIKYQIIINDEYYNIIFLNELEDITRTYQSHQDLVLKGNDLLIKLVARKLEIDDKTLENKKAILRYIYDKYIVNGYCFHSFPSVFKDEVDSIGLTQQIDFKELNDLKKLNYIFKNHNYENILSKDLTSKIRTIYITDSPAMAYYYAFRSPEYMANLTSLSNYYKNITEYDRNAFYEKDYFKCKSNLLSLCKHLKMTIKEETTVLKTFDKRWSKLNLTNSKPCIAFIKRSNLAKNMISNIDQIIDSANEIDLNILVSRIIDSRYPIIRKYSNIDSLDISVVTMPSYREIKNNKFITTKIKKEEKQEEKIKEEEKAVNYNLSYSYGNANVLALLGLLLISLGATLTIIINVLGGK